MTNSNGHRPRRVLVTGGAGFIGSHVCERLKARGGETQALDSLTTGDLVNVPAGVTLHVMDIRDEAAVFHLLRDQQFDAIVHCAAQTSVERSMLDPELDRDVNVVGTHNLLEAARQAGVRRFVFISSGGAIYGETENAATEGTVPAPRSYYGIHKYVAEEFVKVSGLSYGILRPSNVYGWRQRADTEGGVLAIFCDRLSAGKRLDIHGDGMQVRDFICVADVADAAVLAQATSEDVTWNVSSGTATTILEAAHLVARAIEREPSLDFRERRAGDVTRSVLSPARLLETGRWGPPIDLASGLRQRAGRAVLAS